MALEFKVTCNYTPSDFDFNLRFNWCEQRLGICAGDDAVALWSYTTTQMTSDSDNEWKEQWAFKFDEDAILFALKWL